MAALSLKKLPKLLIVVVGIAALVPAGLSQLLQPQGPTPGPLPGIPGVQQCWSFFTSIPGCIMEIYISISTSQLGIIGPECCNDIEQISNKCWLKMLPFSPIFRPVLLSSCNAPSPEDLLESTK
ncbi:hypothetical protein P3X46_031627 [Hevea brasiliensis]|uniref:Prolamin-like domain-containing protein n=1 Tax=Hevea brasiliensis TaxID=3981 RepID=A0ABQ9KP18_HEVBR|nr:hypothetical protein P3X46_031627 [Hevea brasiliensis]